MSHDFAPSHHAAVDTTAGMRVVSGEWGLGRVGLRFVLAGVYG